MASTSEAAPGGAPSSRVQFRVTTLLWGTLAIALALGYLRQFNSPTLFFSAAMVATAAVAVGSVIGLATGRAGEAAYWALVISAAAFLSVAGDLAAPAAFRYGWSAVGILAGAVCGAVAPKQLLRRVLAGAVAGGAAMLGCSLAVPVYDFEWVFDLICAPIVGALVAVLIEWILWLERQSGTPRYITASWLLCAVIIGNLLVPFVLA